MPTHTTLRRSQLIAPFGVGAIHILKGSKAVITAGLDFWYVDPSNHSKRAASEQIRILRIDDEPRLMERFGVSHFRQPPGPETDLPNYTNLEIPLFRFPTWYHCPRCHQMDQRNLNHQKNAKCGNKTCTGFERENLRQVSFAAACDHGHLQDFPWKEWVHREELPTCDGNLSYRAGGSGSLNDIKISCDGCNKRRSLAGIMSGSLPDSESSDSEKKNGWSALTNSLLKKQEESEATANSAPKYYCEGGRVWLGEAKGQPCNRPLRGILINATNGHYAKVNSALWIPPGNVDECLQSLKKKLDTEKYRLFISLRRTVNVSEETIARDLLKDFKDELDNPTEKQLLLALQNKGHVKDEDLPAGLNEEEVIRYPEYLRLQETHNSSLSNNFLKIRIADTSKLSKHLKANIESISLIDKLRETRVMAGFTRLIYNHLNDAPAPESHMWKNRPKKEDYWLPATKTFGEGVFVRFKEDQLCKWEKDPQVQSHLLSMQDRENATARRMSRSSLQISPRFVLLHTLSHLLIRRLVFECGYGSASLRERLYVSDKTNSLMAGILIYTASGDSEGSLGGLVRMGEPENLDRIFQRAVEDAKWCSSDPVCTESGEKGGQGVNGLNMAACHCCALLPETSCENFNSYLDRGLVSNFFGQT